MKFIPCPNPLSIPPNSSYVKTSGRFGCYIYVRSPRRQLTPKNHYPGPGWITDGLWAIPDMDRAFFAFVANVWATSLTPAQKTLWENWAAANNPDDVNGNPQTLTGFEAFVYVNNTLAPWVRFREELRGNLPTFPTLNPPAAWVAPPLPGFTQIRAFYSRPSGPADDDLTLTPSAASVPAEVILYRVAPYHDPPGLLWRSLVAMTYINMPVVATYNAALDTKKYFGQVFPGDVFRLGIRPFNSASLSASFITGFQMVALFAHP